MHNDISYIINNILFRLVSPSSPPRFVSRAVHCVTVFLCTRHYSPRLPLCLVCPSGWPVTYTQAPRQPTIQLSNPNVLVYKSWSASWPPPRMGSSCNTTRRMINACFHASAGTPKTKTRTDATALVTLGVCCLHGLDWTGRESLLQGTG